MAEATANLAELAEAAHDRLGDYESLVFEGRWLRSGELLERARRLAAGLPDLGVGPGDRVVVFAANRPEVQVAYNAVWRAGAVVTPAVFLLPPRELAHVVADSGAALVIASSEVADTARKAAAGTCVVTTDDFPELEREPQEVVARAGDDLAALLYTGGTTGRAKGVMLSHANLALAGRLGFESGHVPAIKRALTALPLSHAFGLLVTVVGFHSVERSPNVLMRWFNAAAWLELAAEHRVQVAAVVPSMIQLLLAEALEDYDLSELRYLVSGAAPLAPELARELGRRLPSVEVREGYGLTETSALVSTNRPGRIRLGSVGEPVEGCEVRIVDAGGSDLPPGEVGEICVRSPMVMRGYWRSPEETDEAIRDGWLHTGDLGYLDDDGYLYVVDRLKDLIIRGGFNVYPRDVEEALLEHDAVESAAVVGRPDPRQGEEVVAFVSLSRDVGADELVAWAKERLGGYKYPREVHVVPQVPLTPVGKIDRKALRARLGGR